MLPLFALSIPFSPRVRHAVRSLVVEASAFLDAVTRPGRFVAEVETLRAIPARLRRP